MTVDSPTVDRYRLDESMKYFRNSFLLMDGPTEKVCEGLDKKFEPTISNDLISR
jgi:hypothetical protein